VADREIGGKPETPEDDVEMGFFGHLAELRSRLMKAILGMLPGIGVGWYFREELFSALIHPFTRAWRSLELEGEPNLIILNPIDAFVAYLKMAVVCGLLVGAPVVFYQLWAFISPGLYRRERRLALPFVAMSTVFFVGGVAFGYFMVFPIAFEYFLGFAGTLPGGENLEAQYSINEILTLEVRLLAAFGLVFEIPVVISFLAAARIVNWKQLLRFGRWWVLISAILAAFLTPPDVGSQLLMLGPLVALYFVSVLLAYIVGEKKVA
jgi:sec-independent protein translocase protein TatC